MDKKPVLVRQGNKILGVRECLVYNIDEVICDSVDMVIDRLQALRDEWEQKGFRNLTLEEDGSYDWREWHLYGVRDETASEKSQRLAKQKREKESKLAKQQAKMEKEIEEYHRLKEKYGDLGGQ